MNYQNKNNSAGQSMSIMNSKWWIYQQRGACCFWWPSLEADSVEFARQPFNGVMPPPGPPLWSM